MSLRTTFQKAFLGTAIALGGSTIPDPVNAQSINIKIENETTNKQPETKKESSRIGKFLSESTLIDYLVYGGVTLQGIVVLLLSIKSTKDTKKIKEDTRKIKETVEILNKKFDDLLKKQKDG